MRFSFIFAIVTSISLLAGCIVQSPQTTAPAASTAQAQHQSLASNRSAIMSFDDCVMAGYPVLRSHPPQCATPDGRVFMKGKGQISGPGKDVQKPGGGTCRNLCGNGQCEQIVCLAAGCPCAEHPMNCPQDCASDLNEDF